MTFYSSGEVQGINIYITRCGFLYWIYTSSTSTTFYLAETYPVTQIKPHADCNAPICFAWFRAHDHADSPFFWRTPLKYCYPIISLFLRAVSSLIFLLGALTIAAKRPKFQVCIQR
ncbi:hypothetical protein F5B21DRAFT_475125 [Xylaria acuta]|nr:hypothetical protein F5B21DRAFT_475125 [Xylaria acuta]